MGNRSSLTATWVAGVIILACAPSLLWAAQVKTEVYSPQMRVAWMDGRPRLVKDLCAAGQCFVQLAPTVTEGEFAGMLQAEGGTVLKAFPHYRLFLVSLPEGVLVADGVRRWMGWPGVVAAEPNRLRYPTRTPNDPFYNQQYQWPRVMAPEGWDIETGSATVVVAIIDSGTDLDHEDLASKIWVNADEMPGDGVDNDGNGYVDDVNGWDFESDDNDPQPHPSDTSMADVVSHGTHVAGIVGAATDNSVGVAGHDWACRLMVCKCFPDNGGAALDSDIIEAIDYAIDNGANVINMSLAGAYSSTYDAPLQRARLQGVVVVAAAGNESHEFTDDPGSWESPVCNDGPNPVQDNLVLGVAATDQDDVKADFSNYDGSSTKTFVDVAAPGVDILSTYLFDPGVGFSQPYNPMSGTSMASPCVAGLAALVKARFPAFEPLQVIEQIKTACDDIDAINPMYAGKLGAGRINTAQTLGLDLPPGPPRAVMAGDTPGDEGGSITVSWSKSPDDGRGRNDVVEYIVYRCDNTQDANGQNMPAGNWTRLATVPVGEPTVFFDTPVPDHVLYWYKVSARDAGANEAESDPAGPAEARDDLPPPPVEGLQAADNQADDGGAISLSWSAYTPPPDFAGYNVYRAEAEFTRIADATLVATLPGDPQRTFYLDEGVEDGVEYWYAVTAYDDEGNEVTEVEAAGPVVSSPNLTISLPSGLLLMSIGANTVEKDMAALLQLDPSTLKLARWDPAQEAYRTYQSNPNDAFLQQAPGRAFWLRLDEPLMLNIAGEPVTQDPFPVQLTAGWNMVGNPFGHDLRWQGVTVLAGGTVYTLPESNSQGITRDFVWTWNPFTNAYQLVSEYEGWGLKTVRQGAGFWILALQNCELRLPSGVGTARATSEPRRIDVDWKLRLVARCGECVDQDNYIGVSSQAALLNAIVTPPRPQVGVELYFENADVGGRAAASFVEPGQARRWRGEVWVAGAGGQEVEISWPDLSSLPRDVRPVFVDEATGRRVYMRTASVYRFRPGPGEQARPFRIEMADAARALQVTSLAARPHSGGASIVFALSAPATVDVEVLNIAGRRVRVVAAGRQMGAGPCSIAWNGTNASGAPVPAGTYIVRVRARTAQGQQVTSLVTLRLQR